jgi:hypothetical protein
MRCDVVELYQGGVYHLYRYHRYQDVRLVWAPEQSAAFFGGDPDNFNCPRFDLDATFMRAYENGMPAQIKDYFRFKAAGAEEGELTFVTHIRFHAARADGGAASTLRDQRYPRDAAVFELRGVLSQYQKPGAEPKRIAASDLFSIENTLKAWLTANNSRDGVAAVRLRMWLATRNAWQDIVAGGTVSRHRQ